MKNINNMKYLLSFLLMFAVLVTFADNPPDPGNDPVAGGEDPLGGGAPIGGGTLILIGLGAAYGAKKVYNLVGDNKEILED